MPQAIIPRFLDIIYKFAGSGNGFSKVSRYSRSAEMTGGIGNKLKEIITKQTS
jgi:hypothetical protein